MGRFSSFFQLPPSTLGYEPLSGGGISSTRRHGKRGWLVSGVAFVLCLLLARATVHIWSGVPDYSDILDYESALPQHDLSLAWPEGWDGRYVKFAVPYEHQGWNNVLQDIIMTSQIALLANRANAFQPYIWSSARISPIRLTGWWPPWSLRSAEIPLNAFVAGPLAGGAISGSDGSDAPPRFISYEWWEVVCPPERRTVLDVEEVRRELELEWGRDPQGRDIIERWSVKLGSMNETCVEVTGDHLFSFLDYGSTRLLSAWDVLKTSPVLTQFEWSPLVDEAVQASLQTIVPEGAVNASAPSDLPGLLAVHIRRGDFTRHCRRLETYQSDYNTWNSFPDYPDQLEQDPASRNYTLHCLPTVDEVVKRMTQVRWDASDVTVLDHVFIMTNAEWIFLSELKDGLMKDGWKSVVTSYDLDVPPKTVEVAVAADMAIGVKADVFLGNGWSSLTSNINLLRRAAGKPPSTTRFW